MSLSTRLLLFFVIVAGVAASSLWIIGGKKNEYSTSLVIDAQPQQVFPYLTQPDRLKQWIDGLAEVSEMVPPPEQELRSPPVTTARVVLTGKGKQIHFQDEIIRFDPDKLVSVQSRNQSQVITSIYQLESKENNKTSLTYRVKTANRGVGRFLAPLNSSNIQVRIENDARRLKELVEENESAGPGGLDDTFDDSTLLNESLEANASSELTN